MTCFPCSVAKRDVELRLTDLGVPVEQIVARVAATQCLMCAMADEQQTQGRPAADA
jgi:hypothetical protein